MASREQMAHRARFIQKMRGNQNSYKDWLAARDQAQGQIQAEDAAKAQEAERDRIRAAMAARGPIALPPGGHAVRATGAPPAVGPRAMLPATTGSPVTARDATATTPRATPAIPANGSGPATPAVPPSVPDTAPGAIQAPPPVAPAWGFWSGRGQALSAPTTVAPIQTLPAVNAPVAPPPLPPQASPTALASRFQGALTTYTDANGGLVDTSAWSPADFADAAAATGNYYNPMVVGPPGSAQANAWASVQVSQARSPVDRDAQLRRSLEDQALMHAQTASMGMLKEGPMSSGVANPSEVGARFAQSGYTGAQAIADGWLTGTGRAGWQDLPGYTNPLNPQGLMGAPYVNQGATPAAPAAGTGAPATPASPPPDAGLAAAIEGAKISNVINTRTPAYQGPKTVYSSGYRVTAPKTAPPPQSPSTPPVQTTQPTQTTTTPSTTATSGYKVGAKV